ncbi:MAG: TldD/PmbA family protein [Stackebrandtia sp.]
MGTVASKRSAWTVGSGHRPRGDVYWERSFELRAESKNSQTRFLHHESNGVAVRTRRDSQDLFQAFTFEPGNLSPLTPVVDADPQVRDLIDGGRDRIQWLSSAEPMTVDRLAAVRGAGEVLAGFDDAICGSPVDGGRCTVRIQSRQFAVSCSDGRVDDDQCLTIHVTARAYSGAVRGFASAASASLADLTAETGRRIALTAADQAAQLRQARPPRSGPRTVIFAPRAAGVLIHEVIGHALEADAAIRGSALWRDRGNRFTHPELAIADDAHAAGAWSVARIDEEGVPLRRTPLVESGAAIGLVTDCLGAERLEHSGSTGHGRRGSHRRPPESRLRHTAVEAGEDDLDAMIADAADGLLVERVDSGEARVDDGEFIMRVAKARDVTRGVLGDHRGAFTVYGNLSDFANLDAIGTRSEPHHSMCGRGGTWLPVSGSTPALRLPRLAVHG